MIDHQVTTYGEGTYVSVPMCLVWPPGVIYKMESFHNASIGFIDVKSFFDREFSSLYHFVEYHCQSPRLYAEPMIVFLVKPKTEDEKYRDCIEYLLEGLQK